MPALRRRRRSRRGGRRSRSGPLQLDVPHLRLVRAPLTPTTVDPMPRRVTVASYNVHRWTGISGRAAPDPARAGYVISEVAADVIALQEVLLPYGVEDPLARLADALGLHVAFAVTRVHRHGELGNAILSRWPVAAVQVLDLSYSRLERRVAVAASFDSLDQGPGLNVLATHLALVDRTRKRQVRSLLEHPQLRDGPSVLLGDMNAWRRRDKASQALDEELDQHDNKRWPATFPSPRPVLALDRIYTRNARLLSLESHDSPAARRASDHLPVVAELELPEPPEETEEAERG